MIHFGSFQKVHLFNVRGCFFTSSSNRGADRRGDGLDRFFFGDTTLALTGFFYPCLGSLWSLGWLLKAKR